MCPAEALTCLWPPLLDKVLLPSITDPWAPVVAVFRHQLKHTKTLSSPRREKHAAHLPRERIGLSGTITTQQCLENPPRPSRQEFMRECGGAHMSPS